MSQSAPVLSVKNLRLTVKRLGLEVVAGVSFAVYPGETVALLGESGAGKSTLFKAILQLLNNSQWDQEGEILFGSTQVNGLSPKELEQVRGPQVRCIFQEPALSLNPSLLIDRQLSEAVLAVEPGLNSTEVEARIDLALTEAGLSPSLVKGKYPAEVSGGQRQRLSIARALLKNAPILILDEATSALDTESEREVQKALENLMKNRTTFVIAHRLSTIRNADRIIVVQDGRIVEEGRHEELLDRPEGVYKTLYNLQH